MREMAQTDSRVERMMQLESLFTRAPQLLRYYFIARRDRADYENSFKQARIDGFAEGQAEGEARGRAEGLAEGRADIARRMLEMNWDPEQIVQATGLSLDEIMVIGANGN